MGQPNLHSAAVGTLLATCFGKRGWRGRIRQPVGGRVSRPRLAQSEPSSAIRVIESHQNCRAGLALRQPACLHVTNDRIQSPGNRCERTN